MKGRRALSRLGDETSFRTRPLLPGTAKCFLVKELPPLDFEKSTRLASRLEKHGIQGRRWLMDQVDFRSYKDFSSVFRQQAKSAEDQQSTAAILMADGELGSPARPVEAGSELFQAMGGNKGTSIVRLYCHRDLREAVEKLI